MSVPAPMPPPPAPAELRARKVSTGLSATVCASNSGSEGPGLQHMSWDFPGGPGGQDVEPTTFRKVLLTLGGLVVPCFQRSYCWSRREVVAWFEVAARGVPNGTSCGKVILTRSAGTHRGAAPLLVIDGQQRLCTSMLLLTAIRDAARQLPSDDTQARQLLDDLAGVMFDPSSGALRLTASRSDRAALASLIAGQTGAGSLLAEAKAVFDACLRRQRGWGAQQLAALAQRLLDRLPIMAVTWRDPQVACQVYLWIQEKSIFSMAAQPDDKLRGRRFRASDLARNLLLSPFLGASVEEQERAYDDLWVPWQAQFDSAASADAAFSEFVRAELWRKDQAPSQFVLQIDQFAPLCLQNGIDIEHLRVYARFAAEFERLAAEQGNENAAKALLSGLMSSAQRRKAPRTGEGDAA